METVYAPPPVPLVNDLIMNWENFVHNNKDFLRHNPSGFKGVTSDNGMTPLTAYLTLLSSIMGVTTEKRIKSNAPPMKTTMMGLRAAVRPLNLLFTCSS